jgi:cation diffusion facilitator CzcD-associated flavoprotein CzcO
MIDTALLVIGAGPYALSAAALAGERGIETVTVGRPMGFWREHMPDGMLLRSGTDWHLDAAAEATFVAYLEEQRTPAPDVDPIPLRLFLDYADWFARRKGIAARDERVAALMRRDGRFEATLESGERITADAVLAAPGVAHYANVPDWAAALPPERCTHTCELVGFEPLAGSRVLIVGGRQSAYEWAALIGEHGAERIDLVHRHEVPRFERVSWSFADVHVERTVAVRGYWRNLPPGEKEAIARRFWEVGRLTLEYWLTPRLDAGPVSLRPGVEVTGVAENGDGALRVTLSDSTRLAVDAVVLACGYRADLARVPYLSGVLDGVALLDGFPVLDDHFQTTIPGLYITGFSATRDFGPFFGFVRGAPAAATLIVRDLLARA